MRKVVEQVLPVTMIGSYPKPRWYQRYNLEGRDLLEWWKLEENYHAYWDATTACIKDQELAGLDIVTDGQMFFDDYGGAISSFVWYWFERINGYAKAKLPNPLARGVDDESNVAWMNNWGGTLVSEKVSEGIPFRMAEMFGIARQLTDKPIKVSVGAGPPNLTYHIDYDHPKSAYKTDRELAEDLVPMCNAELKRLVAAGAEFIQIEDLKAWMLAVDDKQYDWVIDVMNAWVEGVDAKIAWHCCLGAGYGNTFRAVEDALPRVIERWMEVNVEQYAFDFALRDMQDTHVLKLLPRDKEVQAGVIDIRSMYIESDDELVRRIHKVLDFIEPERVYLTTDCGLKALPRFCAFEKLKALTRAARRVREEIGSTSG